MKKPFDITLTTLHVGTKHRLVTLGLHGTDPADRFLSQLVDANRRAFEKLMGILKEA